MLIDSKGNLWIGNNGIGVLLHEGGKTINFTQKNGLGSRENRGGGPLPGDVSEGSPALDRVFSIGEDRDGNIWFGTTGHGAWRYDGESLRNFTEKDLRVRKSVPSISTSGATYGSAATACSSSTENHSTGSINPFQAFIKAVLELEETELTER